MKKSTFIILSVVALGCLASPASAGHFTTGANGAVTFAGAISPRVSAVLDRNKNNPQALAAAVKALLVSDPSLADDVIELANTQADPSIANAIATGYGQAVSTLSGTSSAAARALRAASVNFSAELQVVYGAVASAAPSIGTPTNGTAKTSSTIVVPPAVSRR